MNALWVCPQCDSEARWKGLCRKCTKYNEVGTPLNPVPRMRQPPIVNLPYHPILPTKESFLAQRRRQPTKKQIRAIKDAEKHTCDEECTHDEEDFTEISGEEE